MRERFTQFCFALTHYWPQKSVIFLLIWISSENVISTNVKRWIYSSRFALRRWRPWSLNRLPPPSWVSSTGEHSVSRVVIVWSETDWPVLTYQNVTFPSCKSCIVFKDSLGWLVFIHGYVVSSVPTRISSLPTFQLQRCSLLGTSVQYLEYSS